MNRVKLIQYQSHTILLEDFSNIQPGNEFFEAVNTAKRFIRSQPPKSVLALFDATGAKFNKDAISVLVKFAKGNKPYIKAVAVVGIDGMLRIALGTVSRLSGRSFKMFENRKTASKWLIQQ